jgi:hypothetical protein
MGDFVKIKQIENLAKELAEIPKALETAVAAQNEITQIREIINGLKSANYAREVFTNLESKDRAPITLSLTYSVNDPDSVQVFFNGVFLNNVNPQQGSNIVTFDVPYITEVTDTIVVCYNY